MRQETSKVNGQLRVVTYSDEDEQNEQNSHENEGLDISQTASISSIIPAGQQDANPGGSDSAGGPAEILPGNDLDNSSESSDSAGGPDSFSTS